jgi:hypothetical protein
MRVRVSDSDFAGLSFERHFLSLTPLLQAVLAPAGQASQEVLDIHCGAGQQILRWLGYAACTQLCHRRGKTFIRFEGAYR